MNTTYTFETTQPLTKDQIEYLNCCMMLLPSEGAPWLDLPAAISSIVENKKKSLDIK